MIKKIKLWILLPCILIITIIFWGIEQFKYDLSLYEGITLDLAFSADSTLLASCGEDTKNFHNVQVWSTIDNKLVRSYADKRNVVDSMYKVFFSNDSKRLFAVSYQQVAVYEDKRTYYLPIRSVFPLSICLSKNGKYLVMATNYCSCQYQSYVYLTDMINYSNRKFVPNQSFYKRSRRFICQDKMLLSSDRLHGMILKDTKTWQDIKVLNYPITIHNIGFDISENGKFIVGEPYNKKNLQYTQELWSIENDQKIKDLPGYFSRFSEDSQFFAHANPDHTISIYSLVTGEIVQKLSGHFDKVCAMCFSRNGKWLASASEDKKIKLWSVNLPCDAKASLSNLNETEGIDNCNLNVPKGCSEEEIFYLTKSLKNPNPHIRLKAIHRLAKLINSNTNEVISQLIQNLDDEDFFVISASVYRLGNIAFTINDSNAVEKIIIALIETFKYAFIEGDLIIQMDCFNEECWITYSMPEDTIQSLLKIHKKKNVLPYLIQALNSPDRYIRMHSAYALKYFKNFDENTLDALMQAFHDHEPEVRCQIIDTLQEISSKQGWVDKEKVLPIFIQALQDKDKTTKESAISFLKDAKEKNITAIPSLIQIFHSSSDIFLKRNIISILFNINDSTKETVKKLLMESDIDTKNKVLIDSSCEGNSELAKLSINVGADVNCEKGSALSNAIKNSNRDMVQILINAGANVNIERASFLCIAVYSNAKIEIIKQLIDAGININSTDWDNETPLIKALSHRSENEIVKLLIESGADIHAKNYSGETALMIAINNGYKEDIVKQLINAGIDINATDHNNETPLMNASNYGRTEIVKLLIEAGADIHAKNKNDETALMMARKGYFYNKEGYKDIVEMLQKEANK